MLNVTNGRRQSQCQKEPHAAVRMITVRQLLISLCAGLICSWVWQRTGDATLTGLVGALAGSALSHHVHP